MMVENGVTLETRLMETAWLHKYTPHLARLTPLLFSGLSA